MSSAAVEPRVQREGGRVAHLNSSTLYRLKAADSLSSTAHYVLRVTGLGNLESRKMANQKPASGADLWFVTSDGTAKLRDLEPQVVHLVYAGTGTRASPVQYRLMSISGFARRRQLSHRQGSRSVVPPTVDQLHGRRQDANVQRRQTQHEKRGVHRRGAARLAWRSI
jgi:hypothetical protein